MSSLTQVNSCSFVPVAVVRTPRTDATREMFIALGRRQQRLRSTFPVPLKRHYLHHYQRPRQYKTTPRINMTHTLTDYNHFIPLYTNSRNGGNSSLTHRVSRTTSIFLVAPIYNVVESELQTHVIIQVLSCFHRPRRVYVTCRTNTHTRSTRQFKNITLIRLSSPSLLPLASTPRRAFK